MSQESNTQLIERAKELLETIDSHPSGYDTLLAAAIEKNDLDDVFQFVTAIEAELSRQHFYGAGAF